MQYDVIRADDLASLIESVNRMLTDGWRPVGGVTLTPREEYLQAVVKPA